MNRSCPECGWTFNHHDKSFYHGGTRFCNQDHAERYLDYVWGEPTKQPPANFVRPLIDWTNFDLINFLKSKDPKQYLLDALLRGEFE